MLHSSPTFRVSGGDHPPEYYRIMGRTVQFSKDGLHWRTLSAEDINLHIRLRTSVALWLEDHLQPLRKLAQPEGFSGPERRHTGSKVRFH